MTQLNRFSMLKPDFKGSASYPNQAKLVSTLLVLLLLSVPIPACALSGSPCVGELEYARATMLRIEEEWPLRSRSDAVSVYLQTLADKLARNSRESSLISWRLNVIRDRSGNAFSIGGGYIYVTEGVIMLSRNESEMAAILAHEMGHELAGHFCRREPSILHSFLSLFKGQERGLKSGRNQIGSLTQTVDPEKEKEADRLAVSLLFTAGYNPHVILDLAQRLPSGSSHLQYPWRIETLKQLLFEIPQSPSRDSPQFQGAKSMLEGELGANKP